MIDANLPESEHIVSNSIGRLMELWGFKRNMGRVWTILYLAEGPLHAGDLRKKLGLSAGSVSMTLKELMRWEVVSKAHRPDERREYFEAERDLWKMISKVFRQRELVEVKRAVAELERALHTLESEHDSRDESDEAAHAREAKVQQLLDLARLGSTLLGVLLTDAKVDASNLAEILLGKGD